MRKFFVITVVSLLSLYGCGLFDKSNPCGSKMEKEKFIEVMTDVYLVEAYLETLHASKENINDSVSFYYNVLFSKHSIEKAQLKEAVECYVLERELMTEIHDEVLNSLSLMEAR